MSPNGAKAENWNSRRPKFFGHTYPTSYSLKTASACNKSVCFWWQTPVLSFCNGPVLTFWRVLRRRLNLVDCPHARKRNGRLFVFTFDWYLSSIWGFPVLERYAVPASMQLNDFYSWKPRQLILAKDTRLRRWRFNCSDGQNLPTAKELINSCKRDYTSDLIESGNQTFSADC